MESAAADGLGRVAYLELVLLGLGGGRRVEEIDGENLAGLSVAF